MLMKKAPDIRSSEITDKKLYLRRREFLQAAAATAAGAAAGTLGLGSAEAAPATNQSQRAPVIHWSPFLLPSNSSSARTFDTCDIDPQSRRPAGCRCKGGVVE